jgi:hypothetical protein
VVAPGVNKKKKGAEMSNLRVREELIEQANVAFLELTGQVEDLLDAAMFYVERYPVTSQSLALKMGELCIVISDLGALPGQLASEIARWRKGEERVLSRLGVETQLLNELYSTMEVTALFFIRENIELPKFSLSVAESAYRTLIDCNKLL